MMADTSIIDESDPSARAREPTASHPQSTAGYYVWSRSAFSRPVGSSSPSGYGRYPKSSHIFTISYGRWRDGNCTFSSPCVALQAYLLPQLSSNYTGTLQPRRPPTLLPCPLSHSHPRIHRLCAPPHYRLAHGYPGSVDLHRSYADYEIRESKADLRRLLPVNISATRADSSSSASSTTSNTLKTSSSAGASASVHSSTFASTGGRADGANCAATHTPLWRRGLNDEVSCDLTHSTACLMILAVESQRLRVILQIGVSRRPFPPFIIHN